MFVALETSREVAVVDAYGELEIFRFAFGGRRRVLRRRLMEERFTSATSWTGPSAFMTCHRCWMKGFPTSHLW
jgi:hypothetical protein